MMDTLATTATTAISATAAQESVSTMWTILPPPEALEILPDAVAPVVVPVVVPLADPMADQEVVPVAGPAAGLVASLVTAPGVSARDAAWAAVRACQQGSDLAGLILAQTALELVDAAARRNA